MPKPVLNRIWSFLGAALLYLSINVWSMTQQAQFSLPGYPFKDGGMTAHSVTLYAIPLCGLVFVALLLVIRWHALAEPAHSWAARFPKLANLDFDPYTPQGRFAQAASIIAFVAVPTVALVHFYVKFLQGTAYRADNSHFASCFQHLNRWVPLGNALSGAYYYDRDGRVTRGQAFAPFWEPWLFTFWVAFVLWYAFYCLKPVFWPNRLVRKRRRAGRARQR